MEKLKLSNEQQYFAYHFLQRLPREVCVLLTREPIDNLRALAEKADAFMALHQPQSHVAVATVAAAPVDSDDETVAAVKGGNKKGNQGKKKKYRQQQCSSLPSDERKSPLCWLHIRFADKARRCEQPCA
jgi:hypothetical protein